MLVTDKWRQEAVEPFRPKKILSLAVSVDAGVAKIYFKFSYVNMYYVTQTVTQTITHSTNGRTWSTCLEQ